MNHEYAKRNIGFHAGCFCSRDGCHQRLRWFELAQWNHCHADLQPRRRSRQRRADGDDQHDHGQRDDLLHSGWNATPDICHGNDQEVHGAHNHQRSDDHQGRRDGVRVQSINGRVGGLHDFDGADGGDAVVQSPGRGGRFWNDGSNQHDDAKCDDLLHDQRNGSRTRRRCSTRRRLRSRRPSRSRPSPSRQGLRIPPSGQRPIP